MDLIAEIKPLLYVIIPLVGLIYSQSKVHNRGMQNSEDINNIKNTLAALGKKLDAQRDKEAERHEALQSKIVVLEKTSDIHRTLLKPDKLERETIQITRLQSAVEACEAHINHMMRNK